MRRFWKALVIFCLGGVVGTAFGAALGFFGFRSYFRRRLPQNNPEADRSPLVGTGTSSTPIRPTRSTGAGAR